MFPSYLHVSQRCLSREVDCRLHCHYPTKRRFFPSFHCVKGYSFWSWWQCLHCCMPASFSMLDWPENTLKATYGIKIAACAKDRCPPFPPLHKKCWKIHPLCRSLINCLRSRKRETHRPIVRCNGWCLGSTVERPSCNVVHNRQGIPSDETIHQELNRWFFVVTYCIRPRPK